jgi:hypothetical protein
MVKAVRRPVAMCPPPAARLSTDPCHRPSHSPGTAGFAPDLGGPSRAADSTEDPKRPLQDQSRCPGERRGRRQPDLLRAHEVAPAPWRSAHTPWPGPESRRLQASGSSVSCTSRTLRNSIARTFRTSRAPWGLPVKGGTKPVNARSRTCLLASRPTTTSRLSTSFGYRAHRPRGPLPGPRAGRRPRRPRPTGRG